MLCIFCDASNDSNFVSEVQGVTLVTQSDVGLLGALESVQSVHLPHLHLVEFFKGSFDLWLSCITTNHEHHCVFVFHLLHVLLSNQRVQHHCKLVQSSSFSSYLRSLSDKFRSSWQGQWLGCVESHKRVSSVLSLDFSLFELLLHLLGLDSLCG